MVNSRIQVQIAQSILKSDLLGKTPALLRLVLMLITGVTLTSLAVRSGQAATVNVPAGQPTIQAAIDAASNGDTVLVAPGTYPENINFEGKAITVTSSAGPAVTTIRGSGNGPVVLFVSGEGAGSVLNGFTVTNGNSNYVSGASQLWDGFGGGIDVFQASPTITGNIIRQNVACIGGGGIAVQSSPAALIKGNQILENAVADGCSGGSGGGISVLSYGSVQIIGNLISGNSVVGGIGGGGINLFGVTTPIVKNNVITNNSAIFSGAEGGGINLTADDSTLLTDNVLLVQNLIYGNTADSGGGLYVGGATDQSGNIIILNNTIAHNNGSYGGSAIYVPSYTPQIQFYNNLIIGAPGESALYNYCNAVQTPVAILSNDLFAPGAQGIVATNCDANLVANGNMSAKPLFLDGTANFHLQYGSPAIGSGDASAPDLPSTDLDGNPRVVNGAIDMGVYEFQLTTVSLTPTSLTFAGQGLGTSSAAQPVTLTNSGSHNLLLAVSLSPNFSETDNCGTALAAGGTCTINVTFAPTTAGAVAGSLRLSDNASDNPQTVSLSGTGTGPA